MGSSKCRGSIDKLVKVPRKFLTSSSKRRGVFKLRKFGKSRETGSPRDDTQKLGHLMSQRWIWNCRDMDAANRTWS